MQPFKYNPNFNSGSFRHKVTFQSLTQSTNENGFPVEEWTNVKSAWAMIKTLQGREYIAAAATQNERTVRFIIRYTDGIDSSMRILYKGRIFEIVAPPINDDELDKTLTILCKEEIE